MRRKKNSSFVTLLIFVALIAAGAYVYFSQTFERVAPKITMQNNGFWNLKQPLHVTIEDTSGIKLYKITLQSEKGVKELAYEQFVVPQNKFAIDVQPPKGLYRLKNKQLTLTIEAVDSSQWNFLNGNIAVKKFVLTVDKKRPRVSIVNNSYKISRGGSALVIFSVEDANLEEYYIDINGKKFQAEPFYKEGYYIALLAWPVQQRSFRANVVAKDSAGNITKAYIPLYLKEKQYKVSKITLSDKFLNGKIYDLAEEFEETQGVDDKLEQFKIINEDVRAKNEKLIHDVTSKVSDAMISDFRIKKMYPLKNAQVVAHFGDHRKYYYRGKFVSEAYHMGLDLASSAMAPIKTQNSGDVVFADYNGLYGNMPVISHALGLYTIYGHCSSIDVVQGDHLNSGDKIANTGKSGYAMGDHLHFGVLVQGVEVRPQEWMDARWIKLNITDIIKEAKKIIDRR
ncbi:MAG: M23 family metallopeptidase [Epsilonproteobacteria bacterium]|nr:M23 family metallopeptidase [Campylobacterota bacterium]